MNSENAFRILKLEQNSPVEDIKRAYRSLVLQYHPDRNVGSNEEFLKLKQAYLWLMETIYDSPETKPIKQPPPNEYKLELTLEEIFFGCTKEQTITRKVVDEDGNENEEEKILSVEVKPGLLNETRITIEKVGDHFHEKLPANVVFIVHEKAHPIFQRNRFNLKYTAKITAEDAVLGCEVNVPTLDKDIVNLVVEGTIDNTTFRQIENRGFPYPNVADKRGDLIVTFNVIENVQPIVIEHFLTFAQLLIGCSRSIAINRKIIQIDGSETKEDKVLTLDVKPCTQIGTKITFPREGNRGQNGVQSDVVVIIRDKAHKKFKRDGADLIYTTQISSQEVLKGCTLTIPILNSEPIKWNISGQINKDGYRIVNQGLPCSDDDPPRRGDLIVQFEMMEQSPPIEKEIFVTLNEVLLGCFKQVKIEHKIIDENGNKKIQSKSLQAKIEPGVEDGTKIVLPREGDQHQGKIPSDLVFIVRDQPHNTFRRDRANLEYSVKVTRGQLFNKESIKIPTLNNETKLIILNETIGENSVKRIENCGLPFQYNSDKRGDILVHFDVQQETKLPSNEFEMPLTLEEIYRGCFKRQRIKRKITDAKGISKEGDVFVDVSVRPGSINGTKITIQKVGDREHGKIPADVIFTVQEQDHAFFKREGLNLIYMANVTAQEAIFGCNLKIPNLNNDTFTVSVKAGVTPKTFQRIPRCGLPKFKNPNERGDVIVRFNIVTDEDQNSSIIEQDLPLSLEQILFGGKIEAKFERKTYNLKGNFHKELKIFNFDLKPGTKTGTRFLFPREGHVQPGKNQDDVVYITSDAPHEFFKRNGADLEYIATITHSQLVNGGKVNIPTLEKETKSIYIDGIKEGSTKRIAKYGLPHADNSDKRGDILIRFEITPENPKPKDADIESPFQMTLENVLNGFTKRVKINRRFYRLNGEEEFEDKVVTIEVKPGAKAGTKFRFAEYGDENIGSTPADIVFIAKDKPHEVFKRNEQNLEYTAQIDSKLALSGGQIQIPTLDNVSIPFYVVPGVVSKTISVIAREGLPFFDNINKRGDLLVRYEIIDSKGDTGKKHAKTLVKEIGISVSLNEILNGCVKNQQLRIVTNSNGIEIIKLKNFAINIKPGTEVGTRFLFENEGDQRFNQEPDDIVFVVRGIPHPIFERRAADIVYKATISTSEASATTMRIIQVPTLENIINYYIHGIIKLTSVYEIENQGLPFPDNPTKRGKLIILFDIV